MNLEIQVGTPHLVIHHGDAVFLTEPDGQVDDGGDHGLLFRDTRLINVWRLYADGAPWELSSGGTVAHYCMQVFLTNPKIPTQHGEVPARTIGLALARWMDGGIHEDIDITNFGSKPAHFNLELMVRSDFADLFEIKAGRFVRRGRITTDWLEPVQQLRSEYRNVDFVRALTLTARADTRAVFANGRLSFDVRLPPGGRWHACLLTDLHDGSETLSAPPGLRTCERNLCGRGAARRVAGGCDEAQFLQRGSLSPVPAGGGRHRGTAHAARLRRGREPDAGGGAAVVRGPVRARQPDRGAADRPRHALLRPRRARHARCMAGRGRATTSATPSPGRSCTSCGAANSRISSWCRTRPITARRTRRRSISSRCTPTWKWMRRARAARPPPGDCRKMPRLDRQLRRSRRRRLPGVPDARQERLREHGLEGRRRRGALPRRHAGQGSEGALRVAGLRLRRLAGHGGDFRGRSAGPIAPRRCAPRRRRCSSASTKCSGTRTSASTSTRSTATSGRC